MRIKKSDEIVKIEEALKKAKQKQKESLKKANIEFTENILVKLNTDDNFKIEFKSILEKYNLINCINILENNYDAFKINQNQIKEKENE